MHFGPPEGKDAMAFRGPTRCETIHGPCKMYRVTAPGGSGDRAWWLNESQFAGFVDPAKKEFSEKKWRAWCAIAHNFQPNSPTYDIHVLELKPHDKVDCTVGKVHHQPMTSGQPFGNVLYMGSGEQVYMHDLPTGRLKTPVATNTAEAKKLCAEVAQRQSERLGRRDAPDQSRLVVSNRNGLPRSESNRGDLQISSKKNTVAPPTEQVPRPRTPPKPSKKR